MVLREAVLSLFLGIFVGALFLNHGVPWTAFFRAVDDIILTSLADTDHLVVILFTLFMGGQVEVLNRSPAAQHLLQRFTQRLRSRRRANVVIWLSGVLFFIDDYANILILGNAYRKIVDGLQISRAKLAYLIDTTAAPIASLALVSTWIGFELSVISDSLAAGGTSAYTPFELFVVSIPYRFYPILTLWLSLLICLTGRDFGPMIQSERLARRNPPDNGTEAQVGENPAFRRRDSVVVVPILVLIAGSIVLLGYDGYRKGAEIVAGNPWQNLMNLFSTADPFRCLLWASMSASLAAIGLHGLVLREGAIDVFTRWLDGCRGMFMICIILTLAWSIGDVCHRMETGKYVAGLLGGGLNPHFLPLAVFLFSAGISFATGTSYGTMAIMMPIAVALAVPFGSDRADIMYGTVGSVLGGAIFGDHCSPLSDTTILSAGAGGCSLTEHVSTQLPYALVAALISTICLILVPIPWLPALLLTVLGALAIYVIVRCFGTAADG